MKKLLVANWKMNPRTEREAIKLARASDFKNVIIVPPFPFLEEIKKVLKQASLGAQDVFFENPSPGGAYTGEISATMLKKLGVSYVIIGHSERRHLGETDAVVNKKIKAALAVKLKVIFCVGENIAIRRKGMNAVVRFIGNQLVSGTKGIVSKKNIIVAYEPIWAIGSDKNDCPEDTAIVADLIRKKLGARVLYGGSVNSENISVFLSYGGVDGVLIGGTSLRVSEFKKIVKQSESI